MSDCTFRVINETQKFGFINSATTFSCIFKSSSVRTWRIVSRSGLKSCENARKAASPLFRVRFLNFLSAKQTDTATKEGLACEPSIFNLFTVVNFIYHLS